MTKYRQNITISNTAYSTAKQELKQSQMSAMYELGMKLMLLLNASQVFTVASVTPLLLSAFGRERVQEVLADMDEWIERNG